MEFHRFFELTSLSCEALAAPEQSVVISWLGGGERGRGIQPADQLSYGVIVEAGATVEAVGVDGTGGGLVCLGRRLPDGHLGGVRAGPGYVGGLAGVDPAVPGSDSGHRQSRSFPVGASN